MDAGANQLSYGKFNGKFMGSQSLKIALSARFSLAERHEKRGCINCNLLISRAETEI